MLTARQRLMLLQYAPTTLPLPWPPSPAAPAAWRHAYQQRYAPLRLPPVKNERRRSSNDVIKVFRPKQAARVHRPSPEADADQHVTYPLRCIGAAGCQPCRLEPPVDSRHLLVTAAGGALHTQSIQIVQSRAQGVYCRLMAGPVASRPAAASLLWRPQNKKQRGCAGQGPNQCKMCEKRTEGGGAEAE